MLRAFEYRLNPTEEQEKLLRKHAGHCRWFYNYALEQKEKHFAATKRNLSRYEIQKHLPELKKREDTSWLKEVNSQSLQAVLINLDTAYKNFFEKRAKKPKYKNKKSRRSFQVPQNIKVGFESQLVTIPKFLEGIAFRAHRKFSGEIRQATFKNTPTGKWFVSVLVEDGTQKQEKVKTVRSVVGVDLGIKDLAVFSDGTRVANPKFLSAGLPKLRRAQRSFSRKLLMHKASGREKWSKNLQESKEKLSRLHERVANQRKDFLHKLSRKLVNENQVVCFETLSIQGMSKNHRLARHILDSGWGSFITMCGYKADAKGNHIPFIGRFERSTGTCNDCGAPKHGLTLKDREWVCEKCGVVHDRDLNAACNIRDWGLGALIAQEDIAFEPGSHASLLLSAAQEKERALRTEAPTL